jgi:hypothetical protein
MSQKKRKREISTPSSNIVLRPLVKKSYEDLGSLDTQFIFKGKCEPIGITFYNVQKGGKVKGLARTITILIDF